MTLTFVYTI